MCGPAEDEALRTLSFSRKNRCPRLTGDDPSVPQLRQSRYSFGAPVACLSLQRLTKLSGATSA